MILRAIRSANWPRLGAALSIDPAVYTAAILAAVIAIIIGIGCYASLSGWGSAYRFSDIADKRPPSYVSIGATSFIYKPSHGKAPSEINIYLRDTPVAFLSVRKGAESIVLEWSYPFSLWAEIEKREGPIFKGGESYVVRASNSIGSIPYVRNLTIVIPEGTLAPLLTNVISYGAERGNLDVDRKDVAGLVSSVRELLIWDVELRNAYNRVTDAALWAGEVQFLTLVTFIFFVVLKLIGMFTARLNEICEFALETLPYLGFFGTLLGMGQALQLLGNADVTNATRKAISLGPIGSQMGLAVQTTMFAIILYLAGGFLGRLLDVVSERLREETGADQVAG